jgi:phosphonate dehydrogenase
MGHLGLAVARRLRSFDMQILYADPVALPQEIERSLGATHLELAELLEQSDFVFLLLPLSAKTLHLFDRRMLGRMKPGSFLINVGRGSIDERAIAERLESGHLAGYAADVFEMEDSSRAERPASVCASLIDQRTKTLFTPHLGSAVREARREIELRAARNIFEVLAGRCPPDAINQPAVRP